MYLFCCYFDELIVSYGFIENIFSLYTCMQSEGNGYTLSYIKYLICSYDISTKTNTYISVNR